jgi:hypothetical protein
MKKRGLTIIENSITNQEYVPLVRFEPTLYMFQTYALSSMLKGLILADGWIVIKPLIMDIEPYFEYVCNLQKLILKG